MRKITFILIASFMSFALMAQSDVKSPTSRDYSLKVNPTSVTVQNSTKEINSVTFLRESFEAVAYPPAGWSKLNPDGGTGWIRVTAGTTPVPGWQGGTVTAPTTALEGVNGGNAVAFCTWNTGGTASNDQWLITPQMSNIQTADTLSFWVLRWPKTYLEKLQVKISTTNATAPASFSVMGLDLTFPAGAGDSVWTLYKVPVGALVTAGSNIYVGFREVIANNTNDGASLSIDLISWGDLSANDAAVLEVIVPAPACYLTATEEIQVVIQNAGSATIAAGLPVYYQKGVAAPVTANTTAAIAPGASLTFSFNNVNLSATGLDSIKAWVVLPSDANTANDMSAWYYTYNVPASTLPYTQDFENQASMLGWTTVDGNADGASWFVGESATIAHGGTHVAALSFNETTALNDWFITTCITVNPGTYGITYWYRVQSADYPENFKVAYGTEQTATGMANVLNDHPGIANDTYVQGVANFTVTAAGTYYFGFLGYSAADMFRLLLDDINISVSANVGETTITSRIYPNPATNNIRIESNSIIKMVRIVNVLGQEVYNQVAANRGLEINVSNLNAGVYFVTIETANGTKTSKINIIK